MNKDKPARRHPKYYMVYENSAIISQMWDSRVIFVTTPDNQVAQCIFAEPNSAAFFRTVLEGIFYAADCGLTLVSGPSLQEFLEKVRDDLGVKLCTIIQYKTEHVVPKAEWETSATYHDCMYGTSAVIQENTSTGKYRISIHKLGYIPDFVEISDDTWLEVRKAIHKTSHQQGEYYIVRAIDQVMMRAHAPGGKL